jgi:hypothetical protein
VIGWFDYATGWADISITNLRSAGGPVGIIDPPLSNSVDASRYYRAAQIRP